MGKFKIGDKVEVIKAYNNYKVGEVGTITSINNCPLYRINGDGWGAPDDFFKKVNDLYEDQWHLNDGKVEIPDDADKLEKDGSVVSFRKRKDLEFGEKLRIKKSLLPSDANDTKNTNPGLDYVDAVYISKYFDWDNNEGIKVYINNGEKSWECRFLVLDKVERLT